LQGKPITILQILPKILGLIILTAMCSSIPAYSSFSITQIWWFIGGILVLVIFVITSFVVWQYFQLKDREKHLDLELSKRTQELSYIQSQMNILFKNSPLGIGLASLNGNILSANKAMADIFGYTEKEISQTNILNFFPKTEVREELLEKLEVENTILISPLELKQKDGSRIYVSLSESRLRWGSNEILMGIVQDITKQVYAEETLKKEAERAAVTEERGRLARELHDSATQSLYSALLFSETGKKLIDQGDLESARHFQTRVTEVIYQALKEMRLLVFQLQLPLLDQEGLVGALKFRLDTVEKRSGVDASLEVEKFQDLPSEIILNLYRIALEALNNSLKHAQADSVQVKLSIENGQILLEVIDNGVGFDKNVTKDKAGLGLKNMNTRAENLGGQLKIDSEPGKGTKVRFTTAYTQEPEETK